MSEYISMKRLERGSIFLFTFTSPEGKRSLGRPRHK